jgi:ketosteroid isomerase-like protein
VQGFADGWRAPSDADSFADHFEEWLDPEVRLVQPQVATTIGHRAFREQFARPLFALVPDLHGTVESWTARGDRLAVQLRLEGTVGRRPVTIRTCDVVTLRDARATERIAYLDPTPLLIAVVRTPAVWPKALRLMRTRGAG